MSATKILWGQIIVVFLIVLLTIWAATQWTAWRLGFQPELGQPWFELAPGVPVYLPPAFFWGSPAKTVGGSGQHRVTRAVAVGCNDVAGFGW